MLLSIGMIIKNEERYLRRCLEAMTPILERVDSELIIADTGSTDGSVAIAREFTDKVFHFDWCDDFAAARNATLKKARGEWFMAVDADEIFKDTGPLIEFFNSGEYRDYNSATIIKRNYNDRARNVSSDFNAPRLTKILAETVYVDAIHERLTTYGKPLKLLPVVADHYGYITDLSDDFVKQKSERNLNLLFSQLKANPGDYFCLYNICKTYLFAGDTEKALEFCCKGLKYAAADGNFIQYSLYYHKAMILHMRGEITALLSTVGDYFASRSGSPEVIATDIEMHFLRAEYSYRLGDYGTAVGSFRDYIRLCGEYRGGAHRTLDTMQHSVRFVDDESYRYGISALIDSVACLSGHERAEEEMISVFGRLSNSPSGASLHDLYENTDLQYHPLFEDILEKLMENGPCRERILKEFASFGFFESSYAQLLALRFRYGRNTLTREALREFFEDAEPFRPQYADAVYYALLKKISADEIAAKVSAYDLGNFLFNSPYLRYKDLSEVACGYALQESSRSAAGKLWLSSLCHWALASGDLSEERRKALLEVYKFVVGR